VPQSGWFVAEWPGLAANISSVDRIIMDIDDEDDSLRSFRPSAIVFRVASTSSQVVMTTGSSPIIRGVRLLNDCQVVGRVHFLASDWSARD